MKKGVKRREEAARKGEDVREESRKRKDRRGVGKKEMGQFMRVVIKKGCRD